MKEVNKKRILSTSAFVLTVFLVLIIAGFYMYNIIQWRNYPDFGFGFRAATGINIIGTVSKHGRKCGLEIGDRILTINDKTFENIKEFRSAMNRKLGEENIYLLERKGRLFHVTITNIPIGFKRSFLKSGFLFLMGLCYAFIGIMVFLMKPHKRTSWIFFVFVTIIGLFIIFLYKMGKTTPFWLETVHIFAYAFTPAVFIHLAFSFPQERNLFKRHPYMQYLPYMASGILLLRIRSVTPTMMDVPKTWMIVLMTYTTAAVLLFLGSCLQLWLKSQSEIVKIRSKMILLGVAISSTLPLLDFVSNTLFQIYILPHPIYDIPFLIFFPIFLGYSIVKHDLFNFDAIIKRTYGYVLTTGAIAGVYGVFVLVSEIAFGRFEITKSPMFPLVFILGVVFFFNPIRNRAQKFIDRVFYRLEYDYQETVHRISQTMRSLLKLDEIGKSIMETAMGTLFIDAGGVMLLNRKNDVYECLAEAGIREVRNSETGGKGTSPIAEEKDIKKSKVNDQTTLQAVESETPKNDIQDSRRLNLKLPADAPFIQKMAERKKEVTLYDIQEDPFFQDHKVTCMDTFDQLQATLIVPLIYEDRLTGLISLGEKKSGKFYRREDINLLNTLANQGAVAIENALMIEEVIEKERMEEELSIARDLQVSMLPAACPQIQGFEIAAYSLSAREVGGDFYDFIEMGEQRVGMVIGDVTGKSVSGALVMSASRSIFRMLSEEQMSVGEIMMRANRRTKKDIKTGMFVALLYAVLDANDKTLSLCSAGQTQPIYRSSETGESNLVETKGDTFPLGILEDAEYEETRLELERGDTVILYTDGIVEAMNDREEIFGFDRLLELVQGEREISADALLKKILYKVNEFAGGAAQHDDLTVIVISVEE